MMKIFGIVGKSGNGKTTLLEQLIPALKARGLSVSTIKHTHHQFDIDKPGKDSFRQREAGANEVLLASSQRWALLHENRDCEEPDVDELVQHMTQVDLILVEGFKSMNHPKIEIYRPDVGKSPLWPDDPYILAVATDQPEAVKEKQTLALNNPDALADFIMSHHFPEGAA